MKKETILYIVIAVLVVLLAVFVVHDFRVTGKVSFWEQEAKDWANVSIQSVLQLDRGVYALDVCSGNEVFDPNRDAQIKSEWENEWSEELEWINNK